MNRQWANYSLTLLGDPEMSIWLGSPDRLEVDYEPCIQASDPITVTVRSGGQPVKGAIVCLTDDAGLFAFQTTSAAGQTVFSGLPLQQNEFLILTVTFIDHIPYQGAIGVGTVSCNSVAYYPGDANADSKLDISDPIAILGFLFLGGPGPRCAAAGDANGDGKVDISDPVRILGFLFLGSPPPEGYDPANPLVCPAAGGPAG
jgi:hypothetical protein